MVALASTGRAGFRGSERRAYLVRHAATIATLALVGFVFGFPILWAALSSLKSTNDIVTGTFPLAWSSFVPLRPTFENYVYLFTS